MARTLHASWYHDPAIFERERRAVFGREWLMVGHAGQLRVPGDYLTSEIAGWQLLVVVDDDDRLRGFHNVCAHRAGPVVRDAAGRARTLVCGYHGWSYGLDGRLRSARDFGDSAEVDVGSCGLPATLADTWRGLVFVNLDPHAPPLPEELGPFADECEAFPIETFSFSHELADDVGANWKTYADNYLEGYHIPFVHPRLNRQVDARRYRVDVGDHYCVHSAPPRDGALTTGKWLWRFPNLALNIYPDGMNVERFVPIGPRRTRIVYDYFFTDGARPASNDEVEKLSLEILEEDRLICEAVQRNLESGAFETGYLSPRHEDGVEYFQRLVRDALEE